MQIDVFSVRYTGKWRKAHLLRDLSEIMVSHGVGLVGVKDRVFLGFSESDIEQAAAALFSHEVLERLVKKKHLGLSARKWEQLSRRVPLQVFRYCGGAPNVDCEVEVAHDNILPALGADIWKPFRLPLFGSFVTLRSKDGNKLAALSSELRRKFGVVPRYHA